MEVTSNVLIFPGQGSQKIGMGKDLYDNFAAAKDVFDRVDEALSCKLSTLMFAGDAVLTLSASACLFLVRAERPAA